MYPPQIIFGNFLEINEIGVHFMGESGIGKSTLAYQLISKGHLFIADDIVHYQLSKSDDIIGFADRNYSGKLYLPEKGLLDIQKIFGSKAIKNSTVLKLIVNITNQNQKKVRRLENQPKMSHRYILGKKIPEYTIKQPHDNGAQHIENLIQHFLNTQSICSI